MLAARCSSELQQAVLPDRQLVEAVSWQRPACGCSTHGRENRRKLPVEQWLTFIASCAAALKVGTHEKQRSIAKEDLPGRVRQC